MYRNNDFIYEAISKLEKLINIPIEIDSSRENYTAILTINDVQFVVETKSAIRTSNQGFVIPQLEEMKQNNRRPLIVVAEYISNSAADELKARKINYLDVSGNTYINSNEIVIYIQGQKKRIKDKKNQSRAFQEAGIKILFYLLNKQENLQDSYRIIAEKSNVSIGSVSNVMNELEDLNYLLKTKEKRVLKNKKNLLEQWVINLKGTLRPRILRKKMSFLYPEDARNWQKINTDTKQGSILWGGEPGGAIITGNLKPETFTIFTDVELSEVAKKLRLVPSEHGEIEILQKFWNTNNLEDNNVAPALIVYADLINSGFGRNIEIANQILENELRHI